MYYEPDALFCTYQSHDPLFWTCNEPGINFGVNFIAVIFSFYHERSILFSYFNRHICYIHYNNSLTYLHQAYTNCWPNDVYTAV